MLDLRPAVTEPPDNLPDLSRDAVLVHDQPVEDPEGPGIEILDDRAAPELAPEAEVGLLDGVVGRLLGSTESARKAPQLAAPTLIALGDGRGERDGVDAARRDVRCSKAHDRQTRAPSGTQR